MKVMLSGSRSINSIPAVVESKITQICKSGVTFLVGDAPGADTLFQKLLLDFKYSKVIIHHVDQYPRNNLGSWNSIRVETTRKTKNWLYFGKKDIEMTKSCNISLVIWDGRSDGSVLNCFRALNQDKQVLLFNSHQQSEVKLENMIDFEKYFKSKLEESILLKIEKENQSIAKSKQASLF
jgi:hypothetical protein